jgi:uncharacterized membrane protein
VGFELLLLVIFAVDLFTRAVPYTTILWAGVLQGVILILLGLLYLRWPGLLWPIISRWRFASKPVPRVLALGIICFGIALIVWFVSRYLGLAPSYASYNLALVLVILGLILSSFGVKRGINSRNGSHS